MESILKTVRRRVLHRRRELEIKNPENAGSFTGNGK